MLAFSNLLDEAGAKKKVLSCFKQITFATFTNKKNKKNIPFETSKPLQYLILDGSVMLNPNTLFGGTFESQSWNLSVKGVLSTS